MCAHWKLKTASKNIELVRSSGRVTDTSSAETNLASHLASCAWRLQQGVEAPRCSSRAHSLELRPALSGASRGRVRAVDCQGPMKKY